MMAKSQAQALAAWKHRVKCTGPQAQTIQDEAGQHYCSRPAAARALRQRWADIFGANQPADTHVQSFTLKYALVFIPKEDCPCPLLDQVRPIAISSAIYRVWGRARLRNIAEHLSRVMQPWQAGGVKSLDPEVFLVAAEVDFGSARSGPGL